MLDRHAGMLGGRTGSTAVVRAWQSSQAGLAGLQTVSTTGAALCMRIAAERYVQQCAWQHERNSSTGEW